MDNKIRACSDAGPTHNYFFTDVAELDRTNKEKIRTFASDKQIEVIVNCAAYSAVDKAEDDETLCDLINHIAVKIWQKSLNRLKQH